jgi:hypothetical protein
VGPTCDAIALKRARCLMNQDGRDKPGHDEEIEIRRAANYIGRTSTTSGTKCRSRFWMPCLSVAVEEGQPEQAPFMLR